MRKGEDVSPTTSSFESNPILAPSRRALPDAQRLPAILSCYRDPNLARSVTEIAVTLAPFAALWAAMWGLMQISYGFALVLALPAAGFLVRLFMIQHDCGLGAFFRIRAINDWVGRGLGVFTLTPYDYWKRTHATHHANSGNLDRRGLGEIETLTVGEYLILSCLHRFAYRLYRHPLVMFGIGPTYLFVLQYRVPMGLMRAGWKPWAPTMSTNVGIAIVTVALMRVIGAGSFLMIQGPIFVLAATIGVWLFYVQHQSRTRAGPARRAGTIRRRRCTAPRTTICRLFRAGLALISVCITSIILRAAFLSTVCPRSCATIPNSSTLVDLRFGRACDA
jgi:fatty acid desaturase